MSLTGVVKKPREFVDGEADIWACRERGILERANTRTVVVIYHLVKLPWRCEALFAAEDGAGSLIETSVNSQSQWNRPFERVFILSIFLPTTTYQLYNQCPKYLLIAFPYCPHVILIRIEISALVTGALWKPSIARVHQLSLVVVIICRSFVFTGSSPVHVKSDVLSPTLFTPDCPLLAFLVISPSEHRKSMTLRSWFLHLRSIISYSHPALLGLPQLDYLAICIP